MDNADVERLTIDTIRGRAGECGASRYGDGAGALGHLLFRRLNADPENPDWPGRDRFVLSSGHACVLQYALLHLTDVKTAIVKARETKAEVSGFMKTYLQDAEALDGLEFLSMAEAGELAHLEILSKLNETANDSEIDKIVNFALPLQQAYVHAVREQSLRLAANEDPAEAA